jgi:preprotein translocase subunit SecG
MVLFTNILHVMLSLILILIILLQPGKDSGAVFGGQAGNSAYASRTNANPLGRATTVIAVLFMVTSISLAWFSTVSTQDSEEMEKNRQAMNKRVTKADLEFAVPKLPMVKPVDIMSTPPPPPAPVVPTEGEGQAPTDGTDKPETPTEGLTPEQK